LLRGPQSTPGDQSMSAELDRLLELIGDGLAGDDAREALDALRREIDRQRSQSEVYRHAFETTTADRDAWKARCEDAATAHRAAELALETAESAQQAREKALADELASYRHAFNSTAADRDRIRSILHSLADPLDAGYLRLGFPRAATPEGRQALLTALEPMERAFEAGAFDRVLLEALQSFPPRISQPLDPAYCQKMAAYYLATIHAALGHFDSSARYSTWVQAFNAPPGAADLLPYDLNVGSRLARYRQVLAAEEGAPSVALVSCPKSASAFFSSALAEILRAPILRVSVGEGDESMVIAAWARQLAQGGAVTHEHYPATEATLKALSDSGLQQLWVQVRDPRDVAVSLRRMKGAPPLAGEPPPTGPITPLDSAHFVEFTSRFAGWIDGWLGAAERTDLGFRIGFIRYEEVASSLRESLLRVLGEAISPAIAARVDDFVERDAGNPRSRPNWRKGTGEEWRTLPASVQRQAFDGIPERTRRFLDLKP
jgi:hypothetical protein